MGRVDGEGSGGAAAARGGTGALHGDADAALATPGARESDPGATSVSCSAWFASGCHVVSDSSPPLPPRSQLCEAIQLETRRVLELECLRLTDLRELHGLETAARFIAYR